MYSRSKRSSLPVAPTQSLPSQTMEHNKHQEENAIKDVDSKNNNKYEKMKITNQQKRLSVESSSKWNLSTSVSSVSAAAAQSFRHKMQEAEMIELQAVQMERRGMFLTNALSNSILGATNNKNDSNDNNNEEITKEIDNCEQQGIALMQQALQIRAEVRLDLQNKIERLSAQQKLQANRKGLHASNAQELANTTSELNYLQSQFEALTHEQLKAIERLLVRCNVVATMRFKQSDFDTAIELLEFCLSATEMTNTDNNENEEDDVGLIEQGSINASKKSHLLFPWECDGEVHRRRLRGVTLNNYGCCERRRGHFSQALHYLEESVKCTQVESPVAFMNISAILTQLMCPAEAVEMAERAILLLQQPSSSLSSAAAALHSESGSQTKDDYHDDDEEEDNNADEDERPALLAVAHHNLAMALEPIDPNRALEEYELAFTYSCNVLGKENDTTRSIQRSWNRFVERRHECTNHSTSVKYSKRQLYHNSAEADMMLSDYTNHIFPHPFVYEASRYDGDERQKQTTGRAISPHTQRITAATARARAKARARQNKHEGNLTSQRVLTQSRFAGSDVISPREAIAKLPFVPSASPSLPSSRSTHKPFTKNNTLPSQTPRNMSEKAQTNAKLIKKEQQQRESKRTPSRSNNEQTNLNNIDSKKNNNSVKASKENALSSTLPPFTSSVELGQSNKKNLKKQLIMQERNVRPNAHTMPARALSPLKQRQQKRQELQQKEQQQQQFNREESTSNKTSSRTLSNSPINKAKRQRNIVGGGGENLNNATRSNQESTSPQKYKSNKLQPTREVTRLASSVENIKREPRSTRTPQLTPRSAWEHSQENCQKKESEVMEKKVKRSSIGTNKNTTNNSRLAKLPPLEKKNKEEEHTNEVGEWERDDAHVMSVDALLNTETKNKNKKDSKLSKPTQQDKTESRKNVSSPSRTMIAKSNTSKRSVSPSSAKNNTSNVIDVSKNKVSKATTTTIKSSKTTASSSHKNKIATIHATQLLHQVARGYRARRLLHNSHVKRIKEEEARVQETEAQERETQKQLAAVNTLVTWWRRRRNILHAHRQIQEKRTKEKKLELEEEQRIRSQLQNKLNQRKRQNYTFAKMKHAAIVMQSVARGWLARREYKHARQLKQKGEIAATHIQRLWRGVQTRQQYKQLKAHHANEVQAKLAREVQYAAALCVQRQWRRFAVQKEISPQLAQWHEQLTSHKRHTQEYAARCVQCAWRVYRARGTVNTLRQIKQDEETRQMSFMRRHSAVCILQSFARMILVQKKWHNAIMAAKQRAAHYVEITQPTYKAACVIQRAYRAYVARTTLASLQLQYRVALRDAKRAALALIIQNIGRGYLARMALARSALTIRAEHANAISAKEKYETGRRLRAEWRTLQESIAASLEQVCEDEQKEREEIIEANEKKARHALRAQIFLSKRAIQQLGTTGKKQQPYAPQYTHAKAFILSELEQQKERMLQNNNYNNDESNSLTASSTDEQRKGKPLIAKLQLSQDQPIELGSSSSSSSHDETSRITEKPKHIKKDHLSVLSNFGKIVCAKREKNYRRINVQTYLKEVEETETQEYEHQCALLILSFLRTMYARKLLLQRKRALDEYLERCIIKDKDVKLLSDVTGVTVESSLEQGTQKTTSNFASDALTSSQVQQIKSEIILTDERNSTKTSTHFAPQVNNAADIVNRSRAIRSSLNKTENVKESAKVIIPTKQPEPRLLTRLHHAIDAGKRQHSEQEEEKKLSKVSSRYHAVELTEVITTQRQAALRLTSFCRGCITRAYFHTLQSIRDEYVNALVELQRNELPDLERGALTRYEHYFRDYMQMQKEHTLQSTPQAEDTTKNEEEPLEYTELQQRKEKEERKQVEKEDKELKARHVINRFLLCAIAKHVLVQRQRALAHYLNENAKADIVFVQQEEAKQILHNFTKLMRAKREVALRKTETWKNCDSRVEAENVERVSRSTSDVVTAKEEKIKVDDEAREEQSEAKDEKENTLVRERKELERLAAAENYFEEVTDEEEILNSLLDAEEVYAGQQQEQHAWTLIQVAAKTIVRFMRLAHSRVEYIKRRNAIEQWLCELEMEDANTLKQSHAANTIISFCKVLSAKRELLERVTKRDDYLCQSEHMDQQEQEEKFATDVIARFARVVLAKNELQIRLDQLQNYLLQMEDAEKQETMQKEAAKVIASFAKIVMAKNKVQKRLHARDAILQNMISVDDTHVPSFEHNGANYTIISEEHERHKQQKEQLHMQEEKEGKEVEKKGKGAIDKNKQLYHAACVVQHFFRQVHAKCKLQRLRQQEHERIAQGVAVEELLHHASTTIQRHYRGHLARSYVSALRAYIQLYRLNEIHLEGKDAYEEQLTGSNELVQSSYEYKLEQQRVKLLQQQQQERKDEEKDDVEEMEEVASSYVESYLSDDNDDVVNNEAEVEDSSNNSINLSGNHYASDSVESSGRFGEGGIGLNARKVRSPDPSCSTVAPDESEDRMLSIESHHHKQKN